MLDISLIYRDPLFGLSMLIAIIVVLVFADYGRNKYRLKKRQMALANIEKSYREGSLSDEVVDFFSLSKHPIPLLLFLAKTHLKAGDSAAAIKIYLGMLEKTDNIQEKIIILGSLGEAYLKTGLLQRAKSVFIEILKNNPLNYQILLLLTQTYEQMGEYKNALETLECLEELATPKQMEEFKKLKMYLLFMLISNDNFLSLDKKNKEIIRLMRDCSYITRLALCYICSYARDLFWEEILEVKDINNCIDILWAINKEEIPFKKIMDNPSIADIYRAKGYINDNKECVLFELETLRILNQHSNHKGDLSIEYRCHHCKHIVPFDSYRCQMCLNIGQMDLVLKVKERLRQ